MHEIAHAFLHFDPPLPGLIGGTILQGWVVAKPRSSLYRRAHTCG